ncbi:hypothetical protein PR048_020761, partial [Dryococelus australis]
MKQYRRKYIRSLKLKNFQKEIDLLKLRILTLEKQLETRKEHELKKNEVQKSQLLALRFTHKRCKLSVRQELRSILGNIFTPKQTEKPLNKSKGKGGGGRRYICCHYVTFYLVKKVGIPFPDLSTLWKWTRNVKCAPGVLEVLTVLHARSQTMTLSERLAVLSLDAMQIDGKYCYDQTADQIFRPCKNVQGILQEDSPPNGSNSYFMISTL